MIADMHQVRMGACEERDMPCTCTAVPIGLEGKGERTPETLPLTAGGSMILSPFENGGGAKAGHVGSSAERIRRAPGVSGLRGGRVSRYGEVSAACD